MKKQIFLSLLSVCLFSIPILASLQSAIVPYKPCVEEIFNLKKEGAEIWKLLDTRFDREYKNEYLNQKLKALQERDVSGLQKITINLSLVFNRAFDADMVKILRSFYDRAAQGIIKFRNLYNNEFVKYRNDIKKVKWPYSNEFKKSVINNGLTYIPTLLRIDRVVCNTCNNDTAGLKETDIPNYYHRPTCLYGPNEETDAQARVIQKIFYSLQNYLLDPEICYIMPITEEIGKCISSKEIYLIVSYLTVYDASVVTDFANAFTTISMLSGFAKIAEHIQNLKEEPIENRRKIDSKYKKLVVSTKKN